MARISTAADLWVGNDLRISEGDYAIPGGFTLPESVLLRRVYVRHRGALLGSRWYLQSDTHDTGDRAISLISPAEIEGSLSVCEAFLAHHGYRVIDEYTGLYSR
jgi:hypothetical protein